jgi:diaminopimelate decarboxylase
MSTVMRPTMYHSDDNPFGGYHHISVLEEPTDEPVLCQVVGPACEDSDRYGWDRMLSLHKGQHAIVHNVGAHAPEMTSNYNNWPKAQMLMLRADGTVDIITPAETTEELVARRHTYLEEQYASQSFTPRLLTQ